MPLFLLSMFKTLFIFFFLFSSGHTLAREEFLKAAGAKRLHATRQWERFLHLEKGIFGKKSEADSSNFFTTPETEGDPKEDLLKLVEAIILRNTPTGNDNIICRFPARVKWLKAELSIPDEYFDFDQCTKLSEFIGKHKRPNQSLSLVFSSYYLESPASAFGHTFFRLKNKYKKVQDENPNELLDTGISYAANMTTDNALLYAILGMAGGFYGEYTVIPYYYKIREYNDFESRDLWSYDLNLTDAQILKLLEHLWELGHTKFRYFYFTENCSYELLRILEAVDPKLHLVDQIPFYVIPVDTIKAVYKSGLVEKIEFRPSTKRRLDFYISQLTEEEKQMLFGIIGDGKTTLESLDTLEEESKVKVLDSLMQFIDFKHSKEILNQKGPIYEWKQDVLEIRAQYPIRGVSEVIPVPKDESPQEGHGSTRAGLFLGHHQTNKGLLDLHYRYAMHDILDPRKGHPHHANLEFFDIQLRYFKEYKKLVVQDFTLVDVMTLNPWNEYQRPTSLKANIGLRRKHTPFCDGRQALNAEIGGGITKQLGQSTFFAFGETDASYSNEFKKGDFELGLGPSLNLLHAWNETFLTHAQFMYLHYLYANQDQLIYTLDNRIHFKNKWSLGLTLKAWDKIIQNQVGFFYYF